VGSVNPVIVVVAQDLQSVAAAPLQDLQEALQTTKPLVVS